MVSVMYAWWLGTALMALTGANYYVLVAVLALLPGARSSASVTDTDSLVLSRTAAIDCELRW
jgi:hypothetical protein